jgi:hypothetical protein
MLPFSNTGRTSENFKREGNVMKLKVMLMYGRQMTNAGSSLDGVILLWTESPVQLGAYRQDSL